MNAPTTNGATMYAVFAIMIDNSRIRFTEPSASGVSADVYERFEADRQAGQFPAVRWFCVRSMDDPGYANAPARPENTNITMRFTHVRSGGAIRVNTYEPTYRQQRDGTPGSGCVRIDAGTKWHIMGRPRDAAKYAAKKVASGEWTPAS